MNYFDIIKLNKGKIFKVLFDNGDKLESKLSIVSKINPDDAGQIDPSYIEFIEDENNEEISLDEVISIEILK